MKVQFKINTAQLAALWKLLTSEHNNYYVHEGYSYGDTENGYSGLNPRYSCDKNEVDPQSVQPSMPAEFSWLTSSGQEFLVNQNNAASGFPPLCNIPHEAIYDGSRMAFCHNPVLGQVANYLKSENVAFEYISTQRDDLSPYQTSYDAIDPIAAQMILGFAARDQAFSFVHPHEWKPPIMVSFDADGRITLSSTPREVYPLNAFPNFLAKLETHKIRGAFHELLPYLNLVLKNGYSLKEIQRCL